MIAKATLRIPNSILLKLRERSRAEGRSLNETALRALERGLGEASPNEGWMSLGSLVEVPPTRAYDPAQVRRVWTELGPGARRLDEDLEVVRGDL